MTDASTNPLPMTREVTLTRLIDAPGLVGRYGPSPIDRARRMVGMARTTFTKIQWQNSACAAGRTMAHPHEGAPMVRSIR